VGVWQLVLAEQQKQVASILHVCIVITTIASSCYCCCRRHAVSTEGPTTITIGTLLRALIA
jgi:hypothetical protein